MKWGYSGFTKAETRHELNTCREKEEIESALKDYEEEETKEGE
jgi:hypothetical protein